MPNGLHARFDVNSCPSGRYSKPRNDLDFDHHLADGLSARQAVVCLADLGKVEPLFIKQRLQRAGVRSLTQLRQNGPVFLRLWLCSIGINMKTTCSDKPLK